MVVLLPCPVLKLGGGLGLIWNVRKESTMERVRVSSPDAERIEGAVHALKSLLGSRATTTQAQLEHHSSDESYHPPAPPDVVCFPHTTEEVSEIVKISAKYQLPVIPFGAGTSLEGHISALYGGVTIDLREMNKVLRVSVEDLDATVEAGVTQVQLNRALANTGVCFFVDPGAEATLGGMTATRASGTTTVRTGVRPGGSSSMIETSRSAYSVIASVRGIGVALMMS